MIRIAEDLYLLDGFPQYAINVYYTGNILIDAGTRLAAGRITKQMVTMDLAVHALTHAHPDHQGASHAICEQFNIPLWCGEGDKHAMETGDFSSIRADGKARDRLAGPPHPVERALKEGDEVGSFTVIESPGHTPGHVAYWRESDRVLILGDVLFGMNLLTLRNGLHEPPKVFTRDPALNRESARKVAALNPQVICFGHGKPLDDPEPFHDFVNALP